VRREGVREGGKKRCWVYSFGRALGYWVFWADLYCLSV